MWDSAPKSNDENLNAQTDANKKETKYNDHNQEYPDTVNGVSSRHKASS